MGSLDDNTSGACYAYRASKAALNIVSKVRPRRTISHAVAFRPQPRMLVICAPRACTCGTQGLAHGWTLNGNNFICAPAPSPPPAVHVD